MALILMVLLIIPAITTPTNCLLWTRMEMGTGWTKSDTQEEERAKQHCQALNMCLDTFDKQGDNEYVIKCRAPLPKEL